MSLFGHQTLAPIPSQVVLMNQLPRSSWPQVMPPSHGGFLASFGSPPYRISILSSTPAHSSLSKETQKTLPSRSNLSSEVPCRIVVMFSGGCKSICILLPGLRVLKVIVFEPSIDLVSGKNRTDRS